MHIALGAFSLASLLIISAIANVNGQSILNSGNTTKSTHVTLQDCYGNLMSGILLVSALRAKNVDVTNPKVKQLLTDLCEFYKQELGYYIIINDDTKNLTDPLESKMKIYGMQRGWTEDSASEILGLK